MGTGEPGKGAQGGPRTAGVHPRLRVCGPLEVEIGGRRLESELPGRKGQLLAYLAVNRQRAVRREELIDALWLTNPPLRPEAAFATLLTRTRASVGHATISGSSHLRLELGDGASIDWEVAQAAADAARARLTGPYLAGAAASADEGLAIIARGFLQDHEAAWIDRRRELDELRAPLAEVLPARRSPSAVSTWRRPSAPRGP